MWGAVQRTSNRTRMFIAVGAVLALVAATVFVVHARDERNEASRNLARSRLHLTQLDRALHEAVSARRDALAALDNAREVLRADIAARDSVRRTNGIEYGTLIAATRTLAAHQAQLAAGTQRAALLDQCLIGASQALNEAAVGDLVHLRSTLPRAEQICAQANA